MVMRIQLRKAVPSDFNILLAKINRVKRFKTHQLSTWDARTLTKFAPRLELILARERRKSWEKRVRRRG